MRVAPSIPSNQSTRPITTLSTSTHRRPRRVTASAGCSTDFLKSNLVIFMINMSVSYRWYGTNYVATLRKLIWMAVQSPGDRSSTAPTTSQPGHPMVLTFPLNLQNGRGFTGVWVLRISFVFLYFLRWKSHGNCFIVFVFVLFIRRLSLRDEDARRGVMSHPMVSHTPSLLA